MNRHEIIEIYEYNILKSNRLLDIVSKSVDIEDYVKEETYQASKQYLDVANSLLEYLKVVGDDDE